MFMKGVKVIATFRTENGVYRGRDFHCAIAKAVRKEGKLLYVDPTTKAKKIYEFQGRKVIIDTRYHYPEVCLIDDETFENIVRR